MVRSLHHDRLSSLPFATGKARRLGATQGSRRALSERTTDRWVDVDRLMSPDPGINQQLGQAVAMWQDEALVVGAVGDDFDGSWSGSAEVYRWDPPKSGWALEGVLRPSQKESTVNDRFGGAVAIGKRYAVVGAALVSRHRPPAAEPDACPNPAGRYEWCACWSCLSVPSAADDGPECDMESKAEAAACPWRSRRAVWQCYIHGRVTGAGGRAWWEGLRRPRRDV